MSLSIGEYSSVHSVSYNTIPSLSAERHSSINPVEVANIVATLFGRVREELLLKALKLPSGKLEKNLLFTFRQKALKLPPVEVANTVATLFGRVRGELLLVEVFNIVATLFGRVRGELLLERQRSSHRECVLLLTLATSDFVVKSLRQSNPFPAREAPPQCTMQKDIDDRIRAAHVAFGRPSKLIQAHTAVYATLCLGLWSVVANSLPLAAIIKHEHLQTPAYILMANLAASDVLNGIGFICMGSSVLYYVYTETSPSDSMVRLRFTFLLLSGLSSAYSLLALTAERHWFIVHGMNYVSNVTNGKCKVIVLIVWLWSVLLAMLPNFGWHCASRAEEGCLRFGAGLTPSYVVLTNWGDCDINTTFVASSRASGNITSNVSKCLENDPKGLSYSGSVIHVYNTVYATLCLCFWSVVANTLPLAAIMKHEHLHAPAYILVANLAASDVLTGVVFIFSGSSVLCYGLSETSPSDAMLRLRFTFVLLSGLSSAYSLLALTAERYWFIVHGMTYVNNVTNDKCKVVVLIVWLWSVLLAMLPNFGWHCASRTEEGCLRFGGGLPLSYVALILAFVFIPMAAIIFFNLSVFWCLWKHVNAIAAQEAAVGAPPSVSRKSAVTIVIITVVFLVGWMPFAIKMAMFTQDSASLARMFVFVILNSAINPTGSVFRRYAVIQQ
uniref:G-protein coupled receptors family 1 profile domain-containing protein n=1 Tax=Branchiostoma floridae TaxID=7739 RepID=C3Z2D8_BRAFL|eukprot:XP_002597177.1 hypothetical protein BRAFLDRAFT_66305 [Branchiostoma floridae]